MFYSLRISASTSAVGQLFTLNEVVQQQRYVTVNKAFSLPRLATSRHFVHTDQFKKYDHKAPCAPVMAADAVVFAPRKEC